MDYGLSGKTVLITGAAGGIGRATATVMALEGATVIGVDLDAAGLKELAALPAPPGTGHHMIVADLAARAGTEAAMREALDLAGAVDVLVSAAGVLPPWSQGEPPDAERALTMAVNFEAFGWAAGVLLPGMLERGSGAIVAVASDLAFKVIGPRAYGISKAALVRDAMSLAAEVGPRGIRVNAVAPGPVDTPMWQSLTRNVAGRDGVSQAEAERREMAGRFCSLGRILRPGEVADAIAWLASPRASGVNGEVLNLGGTRDHL